MRAGVVAILAAIAFVLASSASVASAGVFPDLPGLEGAERLTHAKKAPATTAESGTTTHDATATGRVPAPDSTAATAKRGPSPDGAAKLIGDLPAGGVLPAMGAANASAGRPGADSAAALALIVVVLFTRFLYRLNTVGRSA
jgi:hypothetical protein